MALVNRMRRASSIIPHFLRYGTSLQTVCFTTSTSVLDSDPPKPKPVPMRKLKDSFLYGTSSTYLEELEKRYQQDPQSVDKTWASFFKSLEQGVKPEAVAEAYHAFEMGETMEPLRSASLTAQTVPESLKLMTLIRGYQVYGHVEANLDPLNLQEQKKLEYLTPEYYGFRSEDFDREFALGTIGYQGFLGDTSPVVSLRQIMKRLRTVYCGDIGYEYMHVPDRQMCNWLRERIELISDEPFSKEKRIHVLDRLAWSELFEEFCGKKFSAAKRFGLEGCSSFVPGMKACIDRAAELGAASVVIGTAHRGRLNILTNVVRKPLKTIFGEFQGEGPEGKFFTDLDSGDVPYHQGTSFDRPSLSGSMLHLSLLANPSHLEAVDPVVLGKTRAKQYYTGDNDRTKNLPILIHGDGSFSGQGLVYETFHLSDLPDYTVGGTVHIVINNQLAFTTSPEKGRSSLYCTDVAKATNAPVFHVNGDNVEAVVRVCELAAEWRQKWKSDVVVDVVCYRRRGHNEIDEPLFTHPLMYKVIEQKRNAFTLYSNRLIADGVVDKKHVADLRDRVLGEMTTRLEEATQDYKQEPAEWLSTRWKGFKSPEQMARIRSTGVKIDILREVGERITTVDPAIRPHRSITKVYADRNEMIAKADMMGQLDWGMAEALAFATLLSEGNHVRLSGQDVERGTFSHRHAVIHCQKTGATYTPLKHTFPDQPPDLFTVGNSPLAEYSVLGFELGYSLENPNALVLWEAQFGDFANGAQVMIDQFLVSGEAKWNRQCGLVLLLPHGYDGQGPEHSSARIERFLQMVNEQPDVIPEIDEGKWFSGAHLGRQIQNSNFQVVNCTTPANYFHVLRRQVHREFRKPLVIFSPKSLLRHPACKSYLWEFDDIPDDEGVRGVRFKRLIMDDKGILPKLRGPHPPAEPEFKRVVFCSGKIFFDLHARREELQRNDIALVRIEQLAPFPFDLVGRELRRYPNAEIMWCQEEPQNMGAYTHIASRMVACMEDTGRTSKLKYNGRRVASSPATGFKKVHKVQQEELVNKALDLST